MERNTYLKMISLLIDITNERIDIVNKGQSRHDRSINLLYVITIIQSIVIGAIAILALR